MSDRPITKQPFDIAVLIKKLDDRAVIPEQATKNAAGVDLQTLEGFLLLPGERVLVKTGLAIQLPEGYEAQIRPRSGLALKFGVTVLNSPGTIDADYRGEIGVILLNTDLEGAVEFEAGERIAQMVIAPVPTPYFHLVSDLEATERGEDGFGSTGTAA